MSQREPGNLQRQAEHTRPRRRAPIAGYLVILFATAFLLLLMAYFQQQRQNAQTSDALQQSVSAVDALQALMADNEALRGQVAELEGQVEELESQIASLDSGHRSQNDAIKGLTDSLSAMDYFWQIDEAYVRERYGTCRELIQAMEAAGLSGALPDWKATDNERFSPRARYQEIYNALY